MSGRDEVVLSSGAKARVYYAGEHSYVCAESRGVSRIYLDRAEMDTLTAWWLKRQGVDVEALRARVAELEDDHRWHTAQALRARLQETQAENDRLRSIIDDWTSAAHEVSPGDHSPDAFVRRSKQLKEAAESAASLLAENNRLRTHHENHARVAKDIARAADGYAAENRRLVRCLKDLERARPDLRQVIHAVLGGGSIDAALGAKEEG